LWDILTDLDEDASAWAAIERKLDRWRMLEATAFRKKVLWFLNQRGFDYETVRAARQKAWEAVQQQSEH
jgi:SOS response regulatory protein OraA/RecX